MEFFLENQSLPLPYERASFFNVRGGGWVMGFEVWIKLWFYKKNSIFTEKSLNLQKKLQIYKKIFILKLCFYLPLYVMILSNIFHYGLINLLIFSEGWWLYKYLFGLDLDKEITLTNLIGRFLEDYIMRISESWIFFELFFLLWKIISEILL